MKIVVVTGSAGLIGSEATRRFAPEGLVVGVDNDMRRTFFGAEASTAWNLRQLEEELGSRYVHHPIDIRDRDAVMAMFQEYGTDVSAVIHTAAQPSHDWAARQPFTDFDINAGGTLNLLEATRTYAPNASFVFTSTNKVYGDVPNELPLVEHESRWEIEDGHPYADGIAEDMRLDASLHSLFGASKVAADILVQEYGRYFGMQTVCFRGGTLTGPGHAATELHGFLGYLMRCAVENREYTVFGYKGKQVRDAIHSADLIEAFARFLDAPRSAAVYNMGGGRTSNCSVLEAIELVERISGRVLRRRYTDDNRRGDHIWYISGLQRFEDDYPGWHVTYDVPRILQEIHDANCDRWAA